MSTPASYFEGMYEGSSDPWHLAERWYERRKYDMTVAALPRERYRRAFEPACSVGELTRRLAGRCDELLACDRVGSAVDTAAGRVAGLPHVSVRRLVLPEEWPPGTFDLIVLSELLYYFDARGVDDLLERSVRSLEPGGDLVTVHWNHPVEEHLFTGTEIAEAVARVPGLNLSVHHQEEDFTLQVLSRPGVDGRAAPSPARAEGLA